MHRRRKSARKIRHLPPFFQKEETFLIAKSSPAMQRYLKEHQRDFMPEDTKAGMIQAYLDKYTGSMVCSKQLYKEALNHAFDEPKQWEIREINEIMNQCIDRWRYFPNPRMFSEYGRQKGWERENPATDSGNPSEKSMDGFVEVTEQMDASILKMKTFWGVPKSVAGFSAPPSPFCLPYSGKHSWVREVPPAVNALVHNLVDFPDFPLLRLVKGNEFQGFLVELLGNGPVLPCVLIKICLYQCPGLWCPPA